MSDTPSPKVPEPEPDAWARFEGAIDAAKRQPAPQAKASPAKAKTAKRKT